MGWVIHKNIRSFEQVQSESKNFSPEWYRYCKISQHSPTKRSHSRHDWELRVYIMTNSKLVLYQLEIPEDCSSYFSSCTIRWRFLERLCSSLLPRSSIPRLSNAINNHSSRHFHWWTVGKPPPSLSNDRVDHK